MWEGLLRAPRGRLSSRKFILLVTTLLVACFAYLVTPPTVHADTKATWHNDSLVYANNTYDGPQKAKPSDGLGLAAGTPYYIYQPPQGTNASQPNKAYVIYFTGNDPPSATSATYETFTYRTGLFSDPSGKQQITVTPQSQSAAQNTSTSSCSLDGIGWIVCPASKAIAEGMDYLYGVISTFFEVEPLTTTHGNLYAMWDVFRNVANILFVICFVIVIYGQVSGGMISNYTIKKILPRVIVAAIMVNVSYWICALGIDISNILGYAVQDLFAHLRDIAGAPNSGAANTPTPTWANVAAAVLAGGGAAVVGTTAVIVASGTVTGLALLLLSALIPAFFAVLVAVAVLAARQALITIFVILAPLAFAAYLLPNTEEWFVRWRKVFMNLLIMFPAFSVIFGGAELAGTLIIQNTHSIVVVILGMTVQIVPLFITPFLIKLSGGLLTTIASVTNDKSKGIFDRTKNWADGRRSHEQATGARRRAERALRDGHPGRYKTSASRSRWKRGISSAGHRLNPLDRAYARDYTHMRREGMKSADEAFVAGAFTGTAAGRRIDYRNRDASSIKHLGESANARSYNTAMAIGTSAQDVYRRDLHHQAHVDEGIGKMYETGLTNHAERDLQTQINSSAALRNYKIHSDVNAAHAQFQAANVTAEGKQTFQNEIMGDRALKLMNVQTVAFEKEAAVIENTLKNRAEAHWERITSDETDPQFDRALRNMRLQETEASDSLKKAESQWNKLVENIRANGKNAPGITANADKTIAGNIKQLGQDIVVEEWGIEAAKRITQQNMSQELKTNEALRMYAGGIGGVAAANRIYAKSKRDIVMSALEDIDHSRSLLSEYTQKQLVQLHRRGIDRDGNDVSDNQALMQAAMQELALNKGNNWALQKLRDDTVRRYGMLIEEVDQGDGSTRIHYYDTQKDAEGNVMYDNSGKALRGAEITDQDEIDNRRDNQQLVADAIRKSNLKVASISQTDISDLDSGTGVTSGKQAIIRDIVQGKFDPSKIADLDVDELQRMVQVIRDPEVRDRINSANPEALNNLLANIDTAQIHPQTRSRIKNRERGVMFALASYLDPADQPRFDDSNDDPEKYYYAETLDDGSVVRRHRGDDSARRHEAPVKPSAEYLIDEFLNTPS